jgi:DNA polymerase-3 subunit delta'
MAFQDQPEHAQGIQLLQRSLERGRLGHAYLFSGHDLAALEKLARTLAKTLNCQTASDSRPVIDSCDHCLSCRKIDDDNHPDVHWVRPESKLRVVTIDQMRGLMQAIYLKAIEARHKVGVVVAADCMNTSAANAFLKTLEEPPPGSVLILLTTEPQRLLDTILSRCLRLSFAGSGRFDQDPVRIAWLRRFASTAASGGKSLVSHYRLLGVVLSRLAEMRQQVDEALRARSPLNRHEDVEPSLREQWERELAAAIEAEYRHRRSELLGDLQHWMRDVWLMSARTGDDLCQFPDWDESRVVASRIQASQAMENLRLLESLQRMLHTNVQEALALEVGLLKLHLS